jgi:hypothetical protein
MIEDLKGVTDSGFLLLGAKAESHLSNTTMLMELRRRSHSDSTMHGFRSTFKDWAAASSS